MSAFPSTYVVNKLNDHIYKGTAISLGTTRYLALFTTDPTAAGSGTEATGGSYARQSLAFASSSGGSASLSSAATFTAMPAGTFPYYGIFDAATVGNLIVYGALSLPVIANNGDTITIPTSGSSFTLSGS